MTFVPATRLLWLTALVVTPLTTLMVLVPGAAGLAGGMVAAIVLLALTDFGRARSALDGVSVELPELIRTSRGNTFVIDVAIRNAGNRCRELRLGLPFGEGLAAEDAILVAQLPRESEFAKHGWNVRALKRGRCRFQTCFLETRSPFGLWDARSTRDVNCEVRVYPNLRLERKSLAALFLHRGQVGVHAQRQVGKGRDFEQLREYIPGDDYGDIFWKASARRGFPMTKTFQIERTQEVYVLVDHSRLSARELQVPAEAAQAAQSPEKGNQRRRETIHGGEFQITTQLERFLHAALVMGLVAEQQGDLFGLITFADQVDGFIRSRSGKSHFDTCRDALYTLESRRVSPDFEELVIFVRKHLTRRALLVILTDVSDPLLAESFQESMELICRKHMVLAVTLKPENAEPLFMRAGVNSVEDIYTRLAGHFQWADLQEVGRTLGKHGVHLSVPEHEGLSTEVVTQYLNVKRRQVL